VLVGVVAGIGLPTLVVLAAWFWWVPGMVASKAEAAIAARGLRGDVGGVSLRLSGAVFEDVRVEGTHGGLVVELDEIGVSGGLISLAIGGTAAIDHVHVRGGRISVDLAEDDFRDSIRTVLEARSDDDAEAAPVVSDGRALSVDDVTIVVRDAHGILVRATDVEGRYVDRRLSAELGTIALGPGASRSADLEGVGLGASIGDGHLDTLTVRRGTIRWRPHDPEEGPDDEVSLRARVGRVIAMVAEGRAGSVGNADRTESERAEDDETLSDHSEVGWLRYFAPEATIAMESLTVASITDGVEDVVARDMAFRVSRIGADRLRTTGRGAPASGGQLEWSLVLWPLALRGEGNVRFEDLPLALAAPFLPDVPWYEPENARIEGDLTIEAGDGGTLTFEGHITARDVALDSPRIAADPVGGIGLSLAGNGTWSPATRTLELVAAELRSGDARADIAGTFVWAPDRYAADVRATLAPTECNSAVSAIPDDLLAGVDGFSWLGTMRGHMLLKLDSTALDDTELDLEVTHDCSFVTVPAVADLRRVEGAFTHRALEPDGRFFEMTTGPGTSTWASIHAMSPYFIHSVLAHEDASFFRHGGFAPWAIRDALVKNLEAGRFAYGASTITMQLAKNLFLHRQKTLARKVQEVLLTWWLESALEKREILELYLNLIEYGPSIYGARQAASHYFGRDISELSPAESVFLANILPNPKLYHGQFVRGSLSSSLANRMRRLLRHMAARERIDQSALDHGLSEIDAFRFRREGEASALARVIPGNAAPLPFEEDLVGWGLDDDWDPWGDDSTADSIDSTEMDGY
jgi:hypothetical protein